MTATSENGYYVRGADDEIIGNRVLDAGASRDIANNLDHLEDEMGQAWGNVCGTLGGGAGLTYWELSSASTTDYVGFSQLAPIPVFLRVRSADITTTRLVVRLRCYAASAGTVGFYVALMPFDPSGRRTVAPPFDGSSRFAQFGTSSTTAVEALLTVYAGGLGDSWMVPWPTTDQNGNAAEVAVFMGQVEVWGVTTGPLSRIEAFAVREFVG